MISGTKLNALIEPGDAVGVVLHAVDVGVGGRIASAVRANFSALGSSAGLVF